MAIFGNMSITNAGQVLYTKAQSGKSIKFTRMQLGSGQIDIQNPATLVALVNPKFYVPISSIAPNTELKTATISGTINNSGLNEAVYICEIGLWAEDPDVGEILYSYASAGNQGDYMAPASQGAYSWNYQINAAIGNAANVTANLSNLLYDYGVIVSDTSLTVISGGNQKEINKSIDTKFASHLADYTLQIPYGGTTTNSGNDYSIATPAISALNAGMAIAVKINADSTGATTLNWNGKGAKSIKKANGNSVTNLKANGVYTFRYDGTNFILQGEGGEYGTVTADKVLTGYTYGTENGLGDGTMPNNGAVVLAPGASNVPIPAGYHNGLGYVTPGKRFASGTIIAHTPGVTPKFIDGSTSPSSFGSAVVSGLTFKPSIVILKTLSSDGNTVHTTVYDRLGTDLYPETVKISVYNKNTSTSSSYHFKADVSPLYVNNTGFLLPCDLAEYYTYYWIAIE